MYRFILFVKKIYVLLLFIILELAALYLYANSTSYTQAKLLTMSNSAVAYIYDHSYDALSYFKLKEENQILSLEISNLRNELERKRVSGAVHDTTIVAKDSMEHFFTNANVVNNTITRQKNYIYIDKGARDGVEPNMAIISIEGFVVGHVVGCSDKFSIGISILNTDFKSSGRISDSDWYGPIYWDGRSHQHITLSDIPKYAEINRGDTIYTTNFSSIYPAGEMIGTVESFEMNESMLYDVKVRLFARMAAINRVLLIKYNDFEERRLLEEMYDNSI